MLKLRELFPGTVNIDAEVISVRYYMIENGLSLFAVTWLENGIKQWWKLQIPLSTVCVFSEQLC